MSEPKFTAGPLHVGTDEEDMAIAVKTANNEVICRFTGDFSSTEDIANAQLYASAPKMYGELGKIAQFLRVAHRYLTKLYGRRAISEAMEYEAGKIDELLAEARGEVQE